jgi:hypothetical protein
MATASAGASPDGQLITDRMSCTFSARSCHRSRVEGRVLLVFLRPDAGTSPGGAEPSGGSSLYWRLGE